MLTPSCVSVLYSVGVWSFKRRQQQDSLAAQVPWLHLQVDCGPGTDGRNDAMTASTQQASQIQILGLGNL